MKIPKFMWAIIGITPLVMIIGVGVIWWAYIGPGIARADYRTYAIGVLRNKDIKEGGDVYRYQWSDKSNVYIVFSEECCGSNFDLHIIKTSDGKLFSADKIHFCGLEGMGSYLSRYSSEAAFIAQIKSDGATELTGK